MTADVTRVAIVTGSAKGIGAAIVRGLASAGVTVVACDIDDAAVGELAAELSQAGLACEPRRVDVTDATQVKRVIDGVVAELGRIDVLVNNATRVASAVMLGRGRSAAPRFRRTPGRVPRPTARMCGAASR